MSQDSALLTENSTGHIRVRGARVHNLKSVDVDIPRGKLVVLTGVSGSGKSSLAFDTLYAEGQRRYVQSLSAYARQFLDQLDKPDVDFIDGLSPAVAIEQRTVAHNPRSTIATVTEIYDYLRVLYAAAGQPHDPVTGEPLKKMTAAEIADEMLRLPEGTRAIVLAPVVDQERGDFRGLFEKLQRQGFVRVRLDGEIHELEERLKTPRGEPHTVEVVVDRLVLREGVRTRLMEALETALKWNPREVRFLVGDADTAELRTFTTAYANPRTGTILEDFTPKHFSFNTHLGACPTCEGVGTVMAADPQLLVPDDTKSLADGAIKTWWNKQPKLKAMLTRSVEALAKHFNTPLDKPFRELSDEFKHALFHGTGTLAIATGWKIDSNKRSVAKPFEGLLHQVERMHNTVKGESLRAQLARLMNPLPCKTCGGKRLRPEVLGVKLKSAVNGQRSEMNVRDFTLLAIRDAIPWTQGLELTELQRTYCTELQREILKRLEFLDEVGLGYLSLDRESGTLSGGESQRIRLATQIGAGLAGVLYVLDEPSIGLHPADNERLIGTLKRLRDLGNSVLVVEHDEDTMRAADWLIELGPGAGPQGGRIIAQGTPDKVKHDQASLTGAFLDGRASIPVPKTRLVTRTVQQELMLLNSPAPMRRRSLPPVSSDSDAALIVHGAAEHNLRNLTVSFPLGRFICVTGASGSGKSSLVDTILRRALMRVFYNAKDEPGKHERISGLGGIDKVVVIDQEPIGRSPRSNPATYTGAFTPIRELFAQLPSARVRGYDASRFSFNVAGGRCEKCGGDGVLTIDMHFLSDVQVTCDQCQGRRYNRETLEITWKGRSIADVLDMTVSEAARFFEKMPKIFPMLHALEQVGLGYVKLGQSGAALSGGEAQRVKLAAELAKKSTGRTLYLLDEPTTGLHFADIQTLLVVLFRLRDAGNTLIVIEHNLDVIKCADWIIDLGPGGGSEGGQLVADGTPEQVAENGRSATGRFLRKVLG
ncbi:ABC-ATPase UvrA [Verrucomicrobiaceae bacterium SCGC AG-212-N21]|nr:ABC-ATPase UvrA [Verrucomicrobiaceae bacterium SCGC AG-212-N21]